MRKACMAESGVEEQHILASKNGNLPDVPELKCYILCLLEHSGMIEEDGRIHFNEVYHLLTPSMQASVDKVVKECETKRKCMQTKYRNQNIKRPRTTFGSSHEAVFAISFTYPNFSLGLDLERMNSFLGWNVQKTSTSRFRLSSLSENSIFISIYFELISSHFHNVSF